MKTYFSIFYVGGLYAYIFKDIQNINLIFFFFFIAFSFYTLSLVYSVYLAKTEDYFIDHALETSIGESIVEKDKKPFLSNLKSILNFIYTVFFTASILILPFLKLSIFSTFILFINVIFILLNVYYYIIIKEKIKKVSLEVYSKYNKEKEMIKIFNEKEEKYES